MLLATLTHIVYQSGCMYAHDPWCPDFDFPVVHRYLTKYLLAVPAVECLTVHDTSLCTEL